MRNLASIQKIKTLAPIEGADAIEKATVLGWQVVVKKGEFMVGDPCVYFEIDSILPEKPEFEFLKPRKMRIKTIRLRGQVSQGICFPLAILPEGAHTQEGSDVTEILKVIKYEPPVPANLAGKVKGNFPQFMPKTDETRVQVLQHVLDKYKGEICYVTEKLDGSSVTYYLKDGTFGVCSRNLDLLETEDNTQWKIARALDLENKMRSLNMDCALQGEVIGENVQSNKYRLKGQTAKFFNFFDIQKYVHYRYADFKEMMSRLQIETVPVLEENFILTNNIEELVSKSIGKSALAQEVWREGIVIRPLREIIDAEVSNGFLHNDRVSFKCVNPEFLLKYGE